MDSYVLTLFDDAGNPIPIPAIQGVGIKDIRLKSEGDEADAYEIVLDDDRVFVFYARRGRQGATGPAGQPGKNGKGLDIKGVYGSLSELQTAVTSPEQGDMYNVGASAPYTIYMWDSGLGWVSQGQLQGDTGAVFTPSVDADGNLSWTNNGGLANPETVNIKGSTGADGGPGKDGVSVTHSWSGTTLTITSASGTSSANLKGDTGPAYTLTSADKTSIATEAAGQIDISGKLDKSGGTMTGALVTQTNTNYTTRQVRNVIYVKDGGSVPTTQNGDLVLFYK